MVNKDEFMICCIFIAVVIIAYADRGRFLPPFVGLLCSIYQKPMQL